MNYSYFLVKPDGIRYLDEICENIETKYQRIKYYAVNDFEKIIKKLYHKHYEQKGEKFSKAINSYLYALKEIFGNETVLILVADNRYTYEELAQSVFNTKMEIRKKYINNNIGLVTNYGDRKEYIRFLSQTGEASSPRIMNQLGSYRINDMNIIHSPDNMKSATLDELKILIDSGIIDDKNLITYDMIKMMKKYRTVNFQNDMKEKEYQGEIIPNVSGWIKEKIKENVNER